MKKVGATTVIELVTVTVKVTMGAAVPQDQESYLIVQDSVSRVFETG